MKFALTLLVLGLTGLIACSATKVNQVEDSWIEAGRSISRTASNTDAVAWDMDKAVWTAVMTLTNSVQRIVDQSIAHSEARQKYYIAILAGVAGIVGIYGENIKRILRGKRRGK